MINPKKYLGQVFLKKTKIIKQIINYIKPKSKEILLEIGCGTGQLTKEIIKYNNNIIVTEIDKELIKQIKNNIIKKIKLLNINILLLNFKKIYKKKKNKIRIFGNIPYYISRKLIIKFIKNIKYIKNIIILVQKEFAQCLISKKNQKKYCKISILAQTYYNIKILLEINKNNFFPIPKINSILIKLNPKKDIKINFNILNHILNNCFIKKNRKLHNNIKNLINIKKLQHYDKFNLHERVNKISVKKFNKLTKIYKYIKK